jgi:hypothetical protein
MTETYNKDSLYLRKQEEYGLESISKQDAKENLTWKQRR